MNYIGSDIIIEISKYLNLSALLAYHRLNKYIYSSFTKEFFDSLVTKQHNLNEKKLQRINEYLRYGWVLSFEEKNLNKSPNRITRKINKILPPSYIIISEVRSRTFMYRHSEPELPTEYNERMNLKHFEVKDSDELFRILVYNDINYQLL